MQIFFVLGTSNIFLQLYKQRSEATVIIFPCFNLACVGDLFPNMLLTQLKAGTLS